MKMIYSITITLKKVQNPRDFFPAYRLISLSDTVSQISAEDRRFRDQKRGGGESLEAKMRTRSTWNHRSCKGMSTRRHWMGGNRGTMRQRTHIFPKSKCLSFYSLVSPSSCRGRCDAVSFEGQCSTGGGDILLSLVSLFH